MNSTREVREMLNTAKEEVYVFEELAHEVGLKVEKARTILRVIIDNYGLGKTNLSHEDKLCIGENAESINTLMESADDFLFEISDSLKAVLQ